MIEGETRRRADEGWDQPLRIPIGWVWIGLAVLGWSPVVALVVLFG